MIVDEVSARRWLAGLPEYDSLAAERMDRFVAMLEQENKRQNLVSANSLQQCWRRHVADSAQLLLHVPRGTSGAWLDLGTGAGFPGIVLAILRPESEMLLVESRPRRADWLLAVCRSLDLPAHVVPSRLEDIPTRPVTVISARAFAPLPRLLRLAHRFSTADTLWLLPKGRSAGQELEHLQGHMFHVEQSLTDAEAGIIVGSLTTG